MEIDRLFLDQDFRCSDRNKRFLRFITEQFFEGNSNRIKAYTIAVDVFGRPSDFDPLMDPIVRIEATRLRSALKHYYDAHGSKALVHIQIPLGRYIPEFARPEAAADTPPFKESVANFQTAPAAVMTMDANRLNPSTRVTRLAIISGLTVGLLIGLYLMAIGV
jgi:hypothetical protein